MQWVRLYTEILDDEKISKISDFSYKIFTFLLLFCRERELNGEIDVSPSDLSWRFRLPDNKVKKALTELYDVGILSSISPIIITKWNVRQYKSDNVTERVKRFRNKSETFHVTPQSKKRNVIETETETETETEADTNLLESKGSTAEPEPDPERELFLKNLKEKIQELNKHYTNPYDQQAIWVFIQTNIKANPKALTHCLNALIRAPDKIANVTQYLNAILKTENGNYNARDHEQKGAVFKTDKNPITAMLAALDKNSNALNTKKPKGAPPGNPIAMKLHPG